MAFETPFRAAAPRAPAPITIARFGGLELREGKTSLDPCRSPDAVNMVIGPDGLPAKRTGYRRIRDFALFGGTIHGLHSAVMSGEESLLVHAGRRLYLNRSDSARLLADGLSETPSAAFDFGGSTYLLDGRNLYRVADDGVSAALDDPYVPTTRRFARPDGGGGTGEAANLLTARRINRFVTDGEAMDFTLDTRPAAGSVTATLPDGTVYTEGSRLFVNRQTAVVTLASPPPAGEAGLWVTFEAEDRPDPGEVAAAIGRCTLCGAFGGAVFLSGNSDFPGREWGAGHLDPPYFAENLCGDVGDPHTAIAGYLRQQDALMILKAPGADAGIYLRGEGSAPAQGGDGPPAIGGIGSLGGIPLYLSRDGIMRVAGTGRASAREVRPVGEAIGPLTDGANPADIRPATVHAGRYLLPIGDSLIVGQLIGDSRSPVAYNRWHPFRADQMAGVGDVLYFSRGSELFRFLTPGEPGAYLDDGEAIAAHWTSPTLTVGPGKAAHPEAVTLSYVAEGRCAAAVELLTGDGRALPVGAVDAVPLNFTDIDFADFGFDGSALPLVRRFRLCGPPEALMRLRLTCDRPDRGMTIRSLSLEIRPARPIGPHL